MSELLGQAAAEFVAARVEVARQGVLGAQENEVGSAVLPGAVWRQGFGEVEEQRRVALGRPLDGLRMALVELVEKPSVVAAAVAQEPEERGAAEEAREQVAEEARLVGVPVPRGGRAAFQVALPEPGLVPGAAGSVVALVRGCGILSLQSPPELVAGQEPQAQRVQGRAELEAVPAQRQGLGGRIRGRNRCRRLLLEASSQVCTGLGP